MVNQKQEYLAEKEQWERSLKEENSQLNWILETTFGLKKKLTHEMTKLEHATLQLQTIETHTTQTLGHGSWGDVRHQLMESENSDHEKFGSTLNDVLHSLRVGQLEQYKTLEREFSEIGEALASGNSELMPCQERVDHAISKMIENESNMLKVIQNVQDDDEVDPDEADADETEAQADEDDVEAEQDSSKTILDDD